MRGVRPSCLRLSSRRPTTWRISRWSRRSQPADIYARSPPVVPPTLASAVRDSDNISLVARVPQPTNTRCVRLSPVRDAPRSPAARRLSRPLRRPYRPAYTRSVRPSPPPSLASAVSDSENTRTIFIDRAHGWFRQRYLVRAYFERARNSGRNREPAENTRSADWPSSYPQTRNICLSLVRVLPQQPATRRVSRYSRQLRPARSNARRRSAASPTLMPATCDSTSI